MVRAPPEGGAGQVFTVDKAALVKRIGNVSADRLGRILDGVRLLTEPRDVE